MAFILVTRRHVTGNCTFAGFQVDMYCLGVKDAFWQFNEPPWVIKDIIERQEQFSGKEDPLVQIDYPLAHNIIYGAVEFAEELGFLPHKDFALAQYILEEDDERVEYIDIEFGLNGRPAIFLSKERHPAQLIEILNKNPGKGNYTIISEDGDIVNEPDDQEEKAPPFVKPMSREMIQYDNERLMKYLEEKNFSSIEEMNEYMKKNVIGKRIEDIIPKKKDPKSNKEKSDDLMYRAYDNEPEEGIRYAHQALEFDPGNIRAYNYLAEMESDNEKALSLYKKAVESGEKQLGKQFFKENKGHFWGMLETRPYMTAKFGLAQCLEKQGKWKDTIKILQEMLVLNPNDNQGVRYVLSGLLLYQKQYGIFYRLHQQYADEESAFWLFNYAYFVFKTHGSTKAANIALQKAYHSNTHVIDFLFGNKQMPKVLEDYYTPGEENEAIHYLVENLKLWVESPEAMEWVYRFSKKQKSSHFI